MTTKPEILEAAEHIVDFLRRTYTRKEFTGERTLAERIDDISRWVAVRKRNVDVTHDLGDGVFIKQRITDKSVEHGGGNLLEERWRAKRLRELYERGSEEEIFNYGKENINTMTGGWFGNTVPYVGFHNETTQNHLKFFHPDYIGNPYGDYVRESEELVPFYRGLADEGKALEARVLEIRREICADPDFNQRVEDAVEEARKRTGISSELDAPRTGLYQLEEFKRGDRVIPLIKRVEKLYSSTINLTKAVIEVSRRSTS